MALKPLWDNLWGVTVHEQTQESQFVHNPFEKKKNHLLKIVAVGPRCKYVREGDVVILPEDNGGAVVKIVNNQTREIEFRYCVPEQACLAVWEDEYLEPVKERDDGYI